MFKKLSVFSFVFVFAFLLSACPTGEPEGTTLTNCIFVTTTGSLDGSGMSVSNSVATIAIALSRAEEYNKSYIYIASGSYTPNFNHLSISISGPNSNITIVGGWNADFTAQEGSTVFVGNQTLDSIIKISNNNNIHIRDIAVTGGTNTNGNGAGIIILDSSSVTLSNVVISDCFAQSTGGLEIANSTDILCSALSFQNNEVSSSIRDIRIFNSTNITLDNATLSGENISSINLSLSYSGNVSILNSFFANTSVNASSSYQLMCTYSSNVVISNNSVSGFTGDVKAVGFGFGFSLSSISIIDNSFASNTLIAPVANASSNVGFSLVNDATAIGITTASGNTVITK